MSIQPGDLVTAVPSSKCAFGAHDDDDPAMVGAVFRVRDVFMGEHRYEDGSYEDVPSISIGRLGPNGEDSWCLGCFRKLNEGADDAELIARIKSYKPERIDA